MERNIQIENRRRKKDMKKFIPGVFCVSILLCSCGKEKSEQIMKLYDVTSQQSEFAYIQSSDSVVGTAFASDLCVVSNDVQQSGVDITSEVASIYCLDDKEIIYAKNVHQKMNPASLTKVMTALLLLEYGNLDTEVTITQEAMISESGATLCDLKPGDKLTLRQLLNCALVRSGNDAASAIAIAVSGDINSFVDRMNERAKELGATNTHFANPHGLTEENHYTTAYDMYLILNAAMQYDEFLTMSSQGSYELNYENASQPRTYDSTNRYLINKATPPEGIRIVGGKTGTTKAAGSCLALLSKNPQGKWFCSIILKAESGDIMYEEMNKLLLLE